MGNDASRVAVVDVCRGSLVRAQVGARRGTETKLLHMHSIREVQAKLDYLLVITALSELEAQAFRYTRINIC
jgi:aspartyl aminopeptidase